MPTSTLDSTTFRMALSRFASGVTVVTTVDDAGVPRGFTASSFCSLSLEPPLVLVCLAGQADCAPAFEEADTFVVSILAEQQGPLAWHFASKQADKFADGGFSPHPVTGDPVSDGALASLACRVHARHPGGDHAILVGEVLDAAASDAAPLLYYDRSFRVLPTSTPDDQADQDRG